MKIVVDYSINASTAEVVIDESIRLTWHANGASFSSTSGNFAMIAALPWAMSLGRPLHIRGKVDKQLMRNVTLLNYFWFQWRPDIYHVIEITADEITDEEPPLKADYVICLSGGVDSTFAYLTAVNDPRPSMRFEVPLGIFVQGFDYSTKEDQAFNAVLSSVREMVSSFNTDIASIATNWKLKMESSSHAKWDHMNIIGLAAIMHLFGDLRGGLLGSDYTFTEEHAVSPRGTNSTVNRLLGSRHYEINPVGEHMSRIEKIKAIHDWGKLSVLKVCWAGPRNGANCSQCEKCLRTMLMCESLGIDPTPAFGRRPTPKDIWNIKLDSQVKISFIRQAIELDDKKLSKSLIYAASFAILKGRLRNMVVSNLRKVLH